MHGLEAYTVAATGSLAAVFQTVNPPDPSALDHVERLGINGLLALAVVVLWRKLQDKDNVLMQNYRVMADTLASTKAIQEKMADTLDNMNEKIEHMDTVRTVVRGGD